MVDQSHLGEANDDRLYNLHFVCMPQRAGDRLLGQVSSFHALRDHHWCVKQTCMTAANRRSHLAVCYRKLRRVSLNTTLLKQHRLTKVLLANRGHFLQTCTSSKTMRPRSHHASQEAPLNAGIVLEATSDAGLDDRQVPKVSYNCCRS